jgi:hypothetical protein
VADRLWRENAAEGGRKAAFETTPADAAFAFATVLRNPRHNARSRRGRFKWSTDAAQTRLALFVQSGSSMPIPFLVVLVFWLTIIFASFSLFSRLNPTFIAMLFFALSASGAVYLILQDGSAHPPD